MPEIPISSKATPTQGEITVPGTEPLPRYRDSRTYLIDLRGPGRLIDMRAMLSPDEQPVETPEPPSTLPEQTMIEDRQNEMVDMRTARYRDMVARAAIGVTRSTGEES